jgi:hypothetical protein
MRRTARKSGEVKPYYVLSRETGEEILVTSDTAHEYRNSVKFIRLRDKPVPMDTPSPVTNLTDDQKAKKAEQARVRRANKKAAT